MAKFGSGRGDSAPPPWGLGGVGTLIPIVLAAASLCPGRATALLPPPAPPQAYGFIDRTGDVVVPAACTWTSLGQHGEWVSVAQAGKQGFVNLRTRKFTGLIFDFNSLEPWEEPLFSRGPEPALKGGRYGYVDQSGHTVVPFRYDFAREFAENGLAVVKMDGGYGYINRRGELVIPPRFQNAGSFGTNGLAPVRLAGLWGAVDQRGRLIIPARFDTLRLPPHSDLALVTSNGRMGAVDRQGRTVVPIRFGVIAPFGRNGLAAASLDADPLHIRPGGHWGFIDRSGKFVIPPTYEEVTDFEDEEYRQDDPSGMRAPPGEAEVVSVDASGVTSTSYIDEHGRPLLKLPAGLYGSHVSDNGVVSVVRAARPGESSLLGRAGFYDPAHPDQPIVWFDSVGAFYGGLAPVSVVSGYSRFGYADRHGAIVIPIEFTGPVSEFGPDGLAVVKRTVPATGRLGIAFIDRTGKAVLQTAYDSATSFGDSGFSRVGEIAPPPSNGLAAPSCGPRGRPVAPAPNSP